MGHPTRREALARAAGFAVLGIGLATPLAALAGAPHFVPPTGPARLKRTLTRGLSGDAAIVVQRSWDVRFERSSSGYSLSGKQVSVAVDAPPALAALADIERKRIADGFLPMEITPGGMIASRSAVPSKEAVAQAVEVAARLFEDGGMPAQDRAAANRFLAHIHQSASQSLSALPTDLFMPVSTRHQASEEILGAGGVAGEVGSVFTAEMAENGHHMAWAKRVVTTRIGGDERVSSDLWELVS
ncbi:hypothetical protein [Erythrobacter sp. HKB08]|uniref:hypothetical protein n=1 Tax=Erythrobacter sp. HKB08 TaxID=2502843 RepID=UPI001008F71E|nr:hypothetical protein [Erythrobacter sp. HKB08]